MNAESSVDSNLASSGRDTGPPRGVHLVGSVPLSSAEEVFRSVAVALGDRCLEDPAGNIWSADNP